MPKNAKKAVELFERACDEGNAVGCRNLGVAHLKGAGVPKDHAKGRKLIEQACTRGDEKACKM